jgi:hypothetical protein
MRVTRQRAARERLHQQQQQQQAQQQQVVAQQAQSAPASDSACDMMVEPESFNLDPLTVRDPQLCHHYTKEIYSYLRDLELEHRVAPQFMQVRTPGVKSVSIFLESEARPDILGTVTRTSFSSCSRFFTLQLKLIVVAPGPEGLRPVQVATSRGNLVGFQMPVPVAIKWP